MLQKIAIGLHVGYLLQVGTIIVANLYIYAIYVPGVRESKFS